MEEQAPQPDLEAKTLGFSLHPNPACAPERITYLSADSLKIKAQAGEDLINAPTSNDIVDSAVLFLSQDAISTDFTLRATVTSQFLSDYDSGVLIGYFDPEHWFKLCAEVDPHGAARVVSVVTRGRSDDANGKVLEDQSVHLQISRRGDCYMMHSSFDQQNWDLVRIFQMPESDPQTLKIGFAAQSPTGTGNEVLFTQIRFVPAAHTAPRALAQPLPEV